MISDCIMFLVEIFYLDQITLNCETIQSWCPWRVHKQLSIKQSLDQRYWIITTFRLASHNALDSHNLYNASLLKSAQQHCGVHCTHPITWSMCRIWQSMHLISMNKQCLHWVLTTWNYPSIVCTNPFWVHIIHCQSGIYPNSSTVMIHYNPGIHKNYDTAIMCTWIRHTNRNLWSYDMIENTQHYKTMWVSYLSKYVQWIYA